MLLTVQSTEKAVEYAGHAWKHDGTLFSRQEHRESSPDNRRVFTAYIKVLRSNAKAVLVLRYFNVLVRRLLMESIRILRDHSLPLECCYNVGSCNASLTSPRLPDVRLKNARNTLVTTVF